MRGPPASPLCGRLAAPPSLPRRAAAISSGARRRLTHFRISCSSCRRAEASNESLGWTLQDVVLRVMAGAAISFSLVASSLSLPSVGMALGEVQIPSESTSSERCLGEEQQEPSIVEKNSRDVTNEDIVREAWEVVNESFLDADNRGWSPEKWQKKRIDVLSSPIPTRSRAHDTVRKMLASLGDSYTRFLTPAEFSKMARYDLSGIGINLREIPDDTGVIRLKVLGILLDGPAYLAGIRQGDEILSVNGVDVKGKSAFEVSSLLQGPKETFVSIEVAIISSAVFRVWCLSQSLPQVQQGDCGLVCLFKVKRQPVAQTPVFYRLEKMGNEEANVGYVQLKEFNALAKKDLVIALKRLEDGGASYFVLDLRDNRGGLVQAGIEIAKLFLDKGQTVIYTVGRDTDVQRTIVSEQAPLFTSPLIILVNGQTASASEIVSAALHDNCKAILVGDKTYGKGLIQSVYELHDGSGVVVTIGKYVTPKHMDINGNGIRPDFSRIPGLDRVTQYISQCRISSKP